MHTSVPQGLFCSPVPVPAAGVGVSTKKDPLLLEMRVRTLSISHFERARGGVVGQVLALEPFISHFERGWCGAGTKNPEM